MLGMGDTCRDCALDLFGVRLGLPRLELLADRSRELLPDPKLPTPAGASVLEAFADGKVESRLESAELNE